MDPKVFTQSKNLMYKAVYLYHKAGYAQKMIADELNVSTSTVSRLLAKASESGIVTVQVDPQVEQIVALEKELGRMLPIREVIIAPSNSLSPLDSRLAVALEGARYVQNTIKDGDIIGMCNGGTIRYLIQFLNPCRKVHTTFVMLHGTLPTYDYSVQMEENLAAISNVFGGKRFLLDFDAYVPKGAPFEYAMNRENIKKIMSLYEKVNISVSGIGALHPDLDSALADLTTVPEPGIQEFLKRNEACGDILLRFFDANGQECQDVNGLEIMSCKFETYRRIPTKIIVAAGKKKAGAVLAGIRGGLMDVLVTDMPLANELVRRITLEGL